LILAALPFVMIAGGCGIVDNEEPGDTAEITISGTTPVPLELIMSNNFFQLFDQQTSEIVLALVDADTVGLDDLPYTENYALDGSRRFFLRLINTDSVVASVRIQVRISGVDPYDVTTILNASQHEYLYGAF
jgi:hypothetical protein